MNLKKYLPFENYILTSYLPAYEIEKRIAANIEPKSTSIFSGFNRNSTKPYEGQLVDKNFTISRIISYRNSFLPIIKGNISTYLGETQIRIKMRPATFVLVFMSLWLGIVGLVCIGIIFIGLLSFEALLQNGFSLLLLIPFAMFIFGALLITLAFRAESKKSKEFLATLFEGQVKTN